MVRYLFFALKNIINKIIFVISIPQKEKVWKEELEKGK
jgi:hypothetical protein